MRTEIITKCAILFLVSLLSSPVYAVNLSLYSDKTEPGKIIIPVLYGENLWEGTLRITNKTSENIMLDIIASDLKHEGAEKIADMSFIQNGLERSYIRIRLDKPVTEIPFKVSKIDVRGNFIGEIKIKNLENNKTHSLNVEVKKSDKPIPIELVDSKDGRLEFKMSSPYKKSFHFTLKNPDNSVFREVEIQDIVLRKNSKSIIGKISQEWPLPAPSSIQMSNGVDKIPLTLEPGEEKRFYITFKDTPWVNHEGMLVIKDLQNKHIMQEFGITLISPYIVLYVFLLVLSGVVFSLLLTKSLPTSSQKKANRVTMSDIQERIRYLCVFERELRTKFTVELVRAKTLNDNTKIYTPSASERFEAIKTILGKLERYLDIREKISKIYIDIDSRDFLPYSKEQEIRTILKDADLSLYMDKPEDAENKIKSAEELQKFSSDDEQLMLQYCRDLYAHLKDSIEKAEKHKNNIKSEFIKDLMEKLKRAYSEINESLRSDEKTLKEKIRNRKFKEDIKMWDLQYKKIDTYLNFLETLHEDLKKNKDRYDREVIELLRSDLYKDVNEATKLCDSLKLGVDDEMIKAAIENVENQGFYIECEPTDPNVNRLVLFKLKFKSKDNKDLNKSPLLDNLRYVWDFGDKTTKAEGREAFHYFKRRGPFILFRKWIRRNFMNPIWKTFNVCVDLSDYKCKKDIPIKEPVEEEYRSGITLLHVLSFTATLIISCVIVVATHYETYTFKSLKDYLMPFFIGFGLDISSNAFMSKAKEWETKAKGGE